MSRINSIVSRLINLLKEYFIYLFKRVKLWIGGLIFDIFIREYRINSQRFIIPFNLTDKIFRGRFFFGTYENKEIKYLKKYLPSGATVLELGGGIGIVSCLTNNLLKKKDHHVVVEANSSLIPTLQQNQRINQCKFHIENCIIGKKKVYTFYIHKLIVGGSQVRKTNRSVRVKGCTINDLEKKYHLHFKVLIMDIEGAEKDFIEKENLSQVQLIFVEFHPGNDMLSIEGVKYCQKILKKKGFRNVLKDGDHEIWKK